MKENKIKKIIVIAQSADPKDSAVGFFSTWLSELSKHVDGVHVLTLRGESRKEGNIKITVLPQGWFTRILVLWKILFQELPKSDGLFAHMCPEYVWASFVLVRLFQKKMLFWYAHGKVTLWLRGAVLFSDKVFTSTEQGCRIRSKKVVITGQGIATDIFSFAPHAVHDPIRLLMVGRLSPVKHTVIGVETLAALLHAHIPATLTLVGGAYLPSDIIYENTLHSLTKRYGLGDKVCFLGAVPFSALSKIYVDHDILVHGQPGALDKVVLEALSCGMRVVSSNVPASAFLPVNASVSGEDPMVWVRAIKNVCNYWPAKNLRKLIEDKHSIKQLALRIANFFEGV